TFGSSGSGNGQFDKPFGVSCDAGNVYIADTLNHRVQVFTADGEYIRQFEKRGSGKNGIAMDSSNIVYVSDSANNISVFTKEGHFLTSFGTQGNGPGQFNRPTGITISRNGVVYVCDCNNGRIQLFASKS
ncbi:E3 ubiquitin-protein ligase TRIM71, partial [Geodia barretti]